MKATREAGGGGRLALTAGLAGLATWVGLAAGWNMVGVLVAGLVVPVVGFALMGRFSPRGVVVGGIAVLLGASTFGPEHGPGAIGWGDAALLAALGQVALLAGSWAEAKAPRPAAAGGLAFDDGRWMTVVVVGQGPAPGAGRSARVPTMPRNDPERRRLSRLAGRRRAPASAGFKG